MKKQKAMFHQYAGELSRPFWDRVHGLRDEPGYPLIYTVGCLLQDVEGRVEQLVVLAETEQAKTLQKAKKR